MAPSEWARSLLTMLEPDTPLDGHVRASSDEVRISSDKPPLRAYRGEPVACVQVRFIRHWQAALPITPSLDTPNQLASTGTVRMAIAYGQQSVATADFRDSCRALDSPPLRVVGVT